MRGVRPAGNGTAFGRGEVLRWKKENVVKSAIEPTARPRYRDPIECAASSIKSS